MISCLLSQQSGRIGWQLQLPPFPEQQAMPNCLHMFSHMAPHPHLYEGSAMRLESIYIYKIHIPGLGGGIGIGLSSVTIG